VSERRTLQLQLRLDGLVGGRRCMGGRQTVVKEQSVSLDNRISPCAYVNFSLLEKLNSRAREFFSRLEHFETRLHP